MAARTKKKSTSRSTPRKKAAPPKGRAKRTRGSAQASSAAARPTVRVRNKASRRTTNRTKNRPAVEFVPLPGESPEDMLRRLLRAMKEGGKAKDRSLQTIEGAMVRDAKEMLERVDEDLAVFALERTPIVRFHCELLGLHLDGLGGVGAERTTTRVGREVTTEDLTAAIALVVLRRNKFCDRAKACGVPVNLFEIRRALKSSPQALHARLFYLLPKIEALIDQFDSPERARELWTGLNAANIALGELVGEREDHEHRDEDTREERRLTQHSLYSLMLWMSGYGKACFTGDEDGLKRWRLDNMFKDGGPNDSTDEPVPPTPGTATTPTPQSDG